MARHLLLLFGSVAAFACFAQDYNDPLFWYKNHIGQRASTAVAGEVCEVRNDVTRQIQSQIRLLHELGGEWAKLGQIANETYSAEYAKLSRNRNAYKWMICDVEKEKSDLASRLFKLQNDIHLENVEMERQLRLQAFARDVTMEAAIRLLRRLLEK